MSIWQKKNTSREDRIPAPHSKRTWVKRLKEVIKSNWDNPSTVLRCSAKMTYTYERLNSELLRYKEK